MMASTVHITFKAIKEGHPTVPAAAHAALFGKQELSTCNASLILSGDHPPPPSSHWDPCRDDRGHQLTHAVWWPTGLFLPLKPQAPLPAGHPAGYPANYTNCLTVCKFAEPRVGKTQVGKLEENSKGCRNCRYVFSLWDGTAAKGVSQVGLI